MKYVALLSGGKDSCYNLMHCHRNGHELVAAASLGPGQGQDEIDSYMYQTVGQDAIELIAQALDVPLYRRVITGTAVNMGSEYGNRHPAKNQGIQGDETEDLFALLASVKINHPDIEGVSVGAILSTYQRVRVEHVCRRLSLTPLCYLWQREQAELLSEMINAGLVAVLIKVAGIGLMTKHLGQTLGQMQHTLTELNSLYDLHICGEGGEYETLTLDCPLFKHRIQLSEVETVIHSDNDFATVAYLRIRKAFLEVKQGSLRVEPTVPPLLEEKFRAVQDGLLMVAPTPVCKLDIHTRKLSIPASPLKRLNRNWLAFTNIESSNSMGQSVEDETRECFHLLKSQLEPYGLDYSHCININLFISSMDLFGRINAVYATFFGSNPPARACVAVDLPGPGHVKLDVLVYAEQKPRDRYSLHVQGLSYWAPANIGPYSQAIVADEQIFISGQIGMEPSNLSLPSPRSLATETALSCQHVSRIFAALRDHDAGSWKGYTQVAVYWLQEQGHLSLVRQACTCTEEYGTPTLYVVVFSLPKSALVEKQVFAHTGRFMVPDEDGEPEIQALSPSIGMNDITGDDSHIHLEYSHFDASRLSAIICVRGKPGDAMFNQLETFLTRLCNEPIAHGRLFYRSSDSLPPVKLPPFLTCYPITTIPSRQIATSNADDWDYALSIVSFSS